MNLRWSSHQLLQWIPFVMISLFFSLLVANSMAFRILEPLSLAEDEVSFGAAQFGPPYLVADPIEGRVVPMEPLHGCSTPVNAEEVEGRVALVLRGKCGFAEKIRMAEEHGAIGVLVLNLEDDTVFLMTDPASGVRTRILSSLVGASLGRRILCSIPSTRGRCNDDSKILLSIESRNSLRDIPREKMVASVASEFPVIVQLGFPLSSRPYR